jgi:hypothetical protein
VIGKCGNEDAGDDRPRTAKSCGEYERQQLRLVGNFG